METVLHGSCLTLEVFGRSDCEEVSSMAYFVHVKDSYGHDSLINIDLITRIMPCNGGMMAPPTMAMTRNAAPSEVSRLSTSSKAMP